MLLPTKLDSQVGLQRSFLFTTPAIHRAIRSVRYRLAHRHLFMWFEVTYIESGCSLAFFMVLGCR